VVRPHGLQAAVWASMGDKESLNLQARRQMYDGDVDKLLYQKTLQLAPEKSSAPLVFPFHSHQ
jgi:hypothetical protein